MSQELLWSKSKVGIILLHKTKLSTLKIFRLKREKSFLRNLVMITNIFLEELPQIICYILIMIKTMVDGKLQELSQLNLYNWIQPMPPYITALNALKEEKHIDLTRMKTKLSCLDLTKTSQEWICLTNS